MPKLHFLFAWIICCFIISSCNSSEQNNNPEAGLSADSSFKNFETRFLDAYWHHYPAASIFIGYGKYYDDLVIPDSTAIKGDNSFSHQWLDSLHGLAFDSLNENNKISFRIIDNQLKSDSWYNDTLRAWQWDPSSYNLSGQSYYIINQPYAPLDERLRILSKNLTHADLYYAAATHNIHQPTREHTLLAIQQNEGGLDVYGKDLTDSISVSHLSVAEKDSLKKNVANVVGAVRTYVADLKQILANKKSVYRDFRLGKTLYDKKFKYDLVTSFSPDEIFAIAMHDKNFYHARMYDIALSLWPKYCSNIKKPKDSLALVQTVVDKISLQHASPDHLLDTLTKQVTDLRHFISEKDLFDFDTTVPIQVRIMPAYESGVTLASAEFVPPYQKQGTTYFNVADLSKYPPEKAESTLREYNNYSIQYLTIHEAIPGHCLQGIYSNKRSPDIIKSVFSNGTMIEGWAVYCESMMLENGWGDHSPEMQLMHHKWKLRELCNVIIDYGIHCLNYSKADVATLLKKDAFQTDAQVEEKYHRVTVSQVQLCSYYAGTTEILKLRSNYKLKMGNKFTLKGFHEKFLSYGSAPIKYIRDSMMKPSEP